MKYYSKSQIKHLTVVLLAITAFSCSKSEVDYTPEPNCKEQLCAISKVESFLNRELVSYWNYSYRDTSIDSIYCSQNLINSHSYAIHKDHALETISEIYTSSDSTEIRTTSTILRVVDTIFVDKGSHRTVLVTENKRLVAIQQKTISISGEEELLRNVSLSYDDSNQVLRAIKAEDFFGNKISDYLFSGATEHIQPIASNWVLPIPVIDPEILVLLDINVGEKAPTAVSRYIDGTFNSELAQTDVFFLSADRGLLVNFDRGESIYSLWKNQQHILF